MADVVGQNTPKSEAIMGFVTEVERIEAQIKELQLSRTAIYAAAKSQGYNPPAIRYVVKCRKMKPQVREEAEANRDIYMHAAGMAQEPPIYRQLEALAKDAVGEEKMLEAFKMMVPATGEIICTIAGKPLRLWRDKDQQVHVSDYAPVSAGKTHSVMPAAPVCEVPKCTPDEAEEMGRKAYRDNKPIIENPFPFGDERVPRWDRGWRNESGSNGMGNSD